MSCERRHCHCHATAREVANRFRHVTAGMFGTEDWKRFYRLIHKVGGDSDGGSG